MPFPGKVEKITFPVLPRQYQKRLLLQVIPDFQYCLRHLYVSNCWKPVNWFSLKHGCEKKFDGTFKFKMNFIQFHVHPLSRRFCHVFHFKWIGPWGLFIFRRESILLLVWSAYNNSQIWVNDHNNGYLFGVSCWISVP